MREHCVRVERTSDLAGAAVRHVEEAFGIAAVATGTLGHVVHDAAGRALDLISSARAVLAELRDHGAQGTNQIQGDGVRDKSRDCPRRAATRAETARGEPPAASREPRP
jgi:hypothetical protein